MMYKPVVSVITFSGSAQRLYTPVNTGTPEARDLEKNKRFVTWAAVEALEGNGARCYIGDSSVSATNYSTSLAENEQATLGGPEYGALGGARHGMLDLSKVYIIGTAAQKAMLTVFVPDEGP